MPRPSRDLPAATGRRRRLAGSKPSAWVSVRAGAVTDKRDVVVVGAGFAGLACAKRAAERGLSVLVVDQQLAPGQYVHTTGILVREAEAEWPAPASMVRKLSRIRLYAPSQRYVDLAREGYYFLATDTAALLRHLADVVRRAGADVRFATPFRGAGSDGAHLTLDGHDVACRFLVGADGAYSKVARSMGLDRNTRLLKGVEWEYEPLDSVGDCLHCFVDRDCAPGYIGWVVPGVGMTQVGLAVHARNGADIAKFVDRIDDRFGLSGKRVLEKRGGMIPINGLLPRFYGDRVLLVGDAAGMVSPLTAGGIHRTYRFGRLAADAIADFLLGRGPNPGAVVRATYGRDGWKHAARWCYDHTPGACLEAALSTGGLLRRVAGKIFFDRFQSA